MPGAPGRLLRCPRCASEHVRRAMRRGLLERAGSLLARYPFRCQLCQHRFLAWRPGERYVRTPVPDRREYDRLPVDFWTALWVQDRRGAARVRDLSVDGCTLETGEPVRPGDTLHLQLSPAPGERSVTIEVAVVRSVQTGRAGLQFVRVQGEERDRLRDVIRELLRARAAPPGPSRP